MSTRYNTQNPIGSDDVRDMSDNAKNLDEFLNSQSPSFTDRFGTSRETVASVVSQAEDNIGYAIEMSGFKPGLGDFSTGFTVQPGQRNIAWYNPEPSGDGNWYSYLGVIPSPGGYSVPPGTDPATGSLWKPVTDVMLRREITSNDVGILSGKMWAGSSVSIACYGDSTTDGNNTTSWVANSFNTDHNLVAPNAWPAKLQSILREMNKGNNLINVWNAGFSGQRMDNGWAVSNYENAVINNPYYGIPDITIIAFGLNDITGPGSQIDNHVNQTRILIKKIISYGSAPVLMTTDCHFRNGQFGDARDHKEARRELDSAKKSIAKEFNIPLIDIGMVLKEWIQNNNDGYNWPQQQSDGLHFGNNGHSLKAQFIASQLFNDTVNFHGGAREIHQWSSEAAYIGNYATIFKFSNNSQGGNVYFPSAAPVDTDMMTVWVWNTCRNAYLVYQGIENEGITDAVVYTVAPKVEVKELFGSNVTSKSVISPGFKNTSGYQRSDEQFIHSRLKYGLNKITYRSGNSAALFFGSFKLVDVGNKLSSSNALKETGVVSRLFKKDSGAQFVLPQRADGLSNAAGCFNGEKISISFDVSCVRNTGVILLSGQGYTPSQAAVDNNQQVSLLMLRNGADALVMYALQTDNTGAASFILLGPPASGWTTDAKVGRVELYRSGNNQIIEVYDAFQGGNAVLTLTLPNTGITSRWSGYVGGLYAFTTGAPADQIVSINRMIING